MMGAVHSRRTAAGIVALACCGLLRLGLQAHPGHDPQDQPVQAEAVAVVFADFHDPACAAVGPLLDRLAGFQHLRLQRVFKHAPSAAGSWGIHEAALAAGAQGRFTAMHDALLRHPDAGPDSWLAIARGLGLDTERFARDLKEHRFEAAVRRDLHEARAVGVTAIPTVFINGLRFDGIEPLSQYVDKLSKGSPDPKAGDGKPRPGS